MKIEEKKTRDRERECVCVQNSCEELKRAPLNHASINCGFFNLLLDLQGTKFTKVDSSLTFYVHYIIIYIFDINLIICKLTH